MIMLYCYIYLVILDAQFNEFWFRLVLTTCQLQANLSVNALLLH